MVAQCNGRTISAGGTLAFQVAGVLAVPADATAAVVNVTGISPTAPTYLTVFPGPSRPTTADLNLVTGQIQGNLVPATVSASGTVSIYNYAGATNVAVDLAGWYVPPPLTISTTNLPDATQGLPYPSTSLAATGGSGPYTWSATGLPPGLTLAPDGVITGTPTTAGTYILTAVVQGATSSGAENLAIFVLSNLPPLSITSPSVLPDGMVGVPYRTTLTASGGTAPYRWTATYLPAGLSISSVGVISGTPTAAGSGPVFPMVTDATSATTPFTVLSLTINPPLVITTTFLPDGTVGVAYPPTTLTATGGSGPYTWTATGLPPEISLSPTGVLSGTPIAPGPPTLTVTVHDSASNVVSSNLPLGVSTTYTVQQSTFPTVGDLRAVSCVSAADCVAVGYADSTRAAIVVTTDGGATWSQEPVPLYVTSLSGVSCGRGDDHRWRGHLDHRDHPWRSPAGRSGMFVRV